MKGIMVREAGDQDYEFIGKYTVETGWASIPESEKGELNKQEWTTHMLEVFENIRKRETSKIFVATDQDQVLLGYLFVGEGTYWITGQRCGYVYDIFVKQEFRGKGIGALLLEKAEEYSKEKGYSNIRLMVFADNEAATRLYRKMGYRAEAIHMGKALS